MDRDPRNLSALNNLGAAHYLLAQFEQAADAYRQVVVLDPSRGAYSNIGTMYFYLGRYADAIIMYREALDIAPEDHRIWGNLADAYFQLGDSVQATESYRQGIALATEELEVNSSDIEALAGLAHYYSRVGETSRAEEHRR